MRELNNNLYIYFYTFTHVYEKRRKREENNRSEYILERKKVILLSTISHKKKEEAKQNISSSYIYKQKYMDYETKTKVYRQITMAI